MLASSVPLGMVQPHMAQGRSPAPMMPANTMAAAGGPSGIVQAGSMQPASAPSGVIRAGGNVTPGGTMPNAIIPTAAISPVGVPFAPGGAPAVAAPLPGGLPPTAGPCGMGPAGAVAAVGALVGPPNGGGGGFPAKRTEVRFVGPAGMKISWYAPGPNGCTFSSNNQLEAPGRYNFTQAAIYRLKLSDIPNRPGLELYPTLEVVPSNPKTDAFLAHSAVPVVFTEEDFEQVAAGNYVVKVIYLPDPQYQDLAATGPDEVVSSRLDPGVDPIAEAHRRGCILLIVRVGNIDLEAPNTPPMDAPNMYNAPPPAACPPIAAAPGGMMAPGAAPGVMGPIGASGPMGGMVPGVPASSTPAMMMPRPMPNMMPGPMPGPNTPIIMGPNGPMSSTPPAMLPPSTKLPAPEPAEPAARSPEKRPVQPASFQAPVEKLAPAKPAATAPASTSAAETPQAKKDDKPAAEKKPWLRHPRWGLFGVNSGQ
jgi:hypothetical protein